MPSNKPIQCLKPGRHVDANGTVVTFSASDLANIAAVYDPAKHEAQFVVGHPKMDTPSYGASASFAWDGKILSTDPKNVEPQFAELVNTGRFPKVSLALYHPDSPHNPVPGSWYPKHVGFLGAIPPAIKGLKSAEFSEGEEGVHVFMEGPTQFAFLSFFKSLREWFLTAQGTEVADRVVPSWMLDSVQSDLVRDQVESEGDQVDPLATPSFSEPTFTPKEPSVADKDMAAQLAESQRQLAEANAQLTARQDRERAAAKKALHDNAVAFAERMTTDHKVKPKYRDVLIAAHSALAAPLADGAVLQFGEGDEKRDALKDLEAMFSELEEVVPKGEMVLGKSAQLATNRTHVAPEVQFAEGTNVNAERQDLDRRAREIMAEQDVPYLEAVRLANKG